MTAEDDPFERMMEKILECRPQKERKAQQRKPMDATERKEN